MIESIIDYLNAKLALIGYFDKRYCLTEIKSEGENTFPVCYSANGDWQKIQIDQHDGVTYWRKSGDVSSSKVDNPFTTDVLYETTFPLRLVAFKRRGDVGDDDNYTADRLVDVIKKQITFVNETLKSTLKVRKVETIVTSSTTNSADVLTDEFDPPFAPDVPFKWVAVAIEIDVMVVGTADCMDACPTDNDILHGFDFCQQIVVDRLTPTQKTCLQNAICGDADDATLDINGAPFTTIPSGDTYDLDVVNSDDDAVGTSAAGDWVIADSTVRNNATPTWWETVKAEDTLTLAQAKMQDSDGSTVTADYIPESQGFMFTATSCPPCADATVEVNGVSVGTVASGGTFNQLVQDDAGASIGTSANPSIVADCVVNNDASSPTFTQNIQPEQTFSLAQGKMLDSDGSTTVLADYIPNTDGFMFTATPCTSPTITFTGGSAIGYGEALTIGCSETYDEYFWHFCSQSFADTHIDATGQNPSPVLQWDGVWDVQLTVRSGTSYGYATTTVTVNDGLRYNDIAYIANTGGGYTGSDKLYKIDDTIYWGDNDNFVLLSDEQLSGEGGFIFQMGKTGIKTIGFSLLQDDPSTGFEYTSTSFKWGVFRWFNDKLQLKNGASSYPTITTIDLTDMKWFKIQRNASNEFDLYYGDSATTNTWTHIYDFSDTDASDVYLLCYLHSGNDNNYNRVLKFGTYV